MATGRAGPARAYASGDLDVDGDLKEGLRRCWTAARDGAMAPPRLRQLPGSRWPPRAPGRDRAAISHHYDLGDDSPRSYWTSTWPSPAAGGLTTTTLVEAQRTKLDLVCRTLDLRPGARMLDVGCGSLVVHAAREYGAKVTGVTIFREQHAS